MTDSEREPDDVDALAEGRRLRGLASRRRLPDQVAAVYVREGGREAFTVAMDLSVAELRQASVQCGYVTGFVPAVVLTREDLGRGMAQTALS